jgi:hypothetical protein
MKPKKLNLKKRTIVLLNEQMNDLQGGLLVTTTNSGNTNSTACPTLTTDPHKTCMDALTQQSCFICVPDPITLTVQL